MHNEVVQFLNSKISGAEASAPERENGDVPVYVNPTHLFEVCKLLKETQEFQVNVLQVVTGCDYQDHIEVSYVLASFIKNTELILKVKLPKPSKDFVPEVDSVCELWSSANFLERECFDMLGVNFLNHPDLRRLLCPEDWEGYPLRKDYVAQEKYQGMDVNPEHKMNRADHHYFKKVQDEIGDMKKVTYSWKEEETSVESEG